MTTILLISLFVCYVVQKIAEAACPDGLVDSWFALSLTGLKHWRVHQLLTFQFMHGGLWHLLGNMIGIYFFGRAMEETLGRNGLLKLYLLSGTFGGLLQIALAFILPTYFDHSVVGASAGVFGLIAAFATRAPDQPITLLVFFVLPVTFPAKIFLLIFAFISVFGLVGPLMNPPMLSNIAHAAHLGGMITGIFYMRWAGRLERPFEFWRPFARRNPPKRELVSAAPRRAWRSARAPVEDLPPAEFISREVDPILEKISAQGIHSLTERERQVLEAARNKMAKR
jgi:membrane associated rhomboid family serine protease